MNKKKKTLKEYETIIEELRIELQAAKEENKECIDYIHSIIQEFNDLKNKYYELQGKYIVLKFKGGIFENK